MSRLLDLTGLRFGRLTVIERGESVKGRTMWVCRCTCGNIINAEAYNIKSGNTMSCGCFKTEINTERLTTHGERDSIEYQSWASMLARTTNKKDIGYRNYGGRGITVCDRWKGSFENFLIDMGRRPSPKHSLDRVDNALGYFPTNCRWATRSEQARNRRSSYLVKYKGEVRSLVEWSEISKVKYSMLYARIATLGWEVARAFETPSRRRTR